MLSKSPMAPIFVHVFKAMLKLSCDADNVTKQLFLTLTFQCIHWFTNNRQYENPDTAALLNSIMDGLITPNDSGLREFSAQCLKEFVKWSRKQSKNSDQIQVNMKSILKRILSYCKHPSAFKRLGELPYLFRLFIIYRCMLLGGCMGWNSIYQEVRENEKSCDIWMVEILHSLFTCLKLCQEDDPLLGTQDLCVKVIKHVEKIIRTRKTLFNQVVFS